MRPGIPTVAEVEALGADGMYRDVLEYSEGFARRLRGMLSRYRWCLSTNPMRNWSRRWEYPFAAERLLPPTTKAGRPMRVLDAGSGVTFFPFFLSERAHGMEVLCCDRNRRFGRMIAHAGEALGTDRVGFARSGIERLPADDEAVDAVCCISVLEHTSDHARILDEFRRVLSPGGRLVLTFDISLDGRGRLTRDHAADLLRQMFERFENDEGLSIDAELARLDRPEDVLTTDWVRRTAPEQLPWKYPMLKSVWDLLRGRGWSGGFYRLACCGASGRRVD